MDAPRTHSDDDASAALPWESIGFEEDDAPELGPEASPPHTAACENPVRVTRVFVPGRAFEDVVPASVVASESGHSHETEPDDEPVGPPIAGGGWTIPLLCAGLCLIACCLIIPQADLNRRAAYERRTLEIDLASIQKQVAVNDEFLHCVADDPTLAERLAQRQMKIVRQGSRVLTLDGAKRAPEMSPFQLVNVPKPVPMPPYKPIGGVIAGLCYQPRLRLYLTGVGMLMVAGGLVLGLGPRL